MNALDVGIATELVDAMFWLAFCFGGVFGLVAFAVGSYWADWRANH